MNHAYMTQYFEAAKCSYGRCDLCGNTGLVLTARGRRQVRLFRRLMTVQAQDVKPGWHMWTSAGWQSVKVGEYGGQTVAAAGPLWRLNDVWHAADEPVYAAESTAAVLDRVMEAQRVE